ncbi:TetR/AcrR family transcriptional regulator [Lacticaseibacillus pabuli]|uniref:TetR/AcrR family transcriptional regulator n=1 Tax=Lacticaseibacillus pabuli TaxID=3025672 RepID=A0ABY7WR11_9LACO|nr:TetR/AcrR family transcriptional regulator [Lacticaseibacillus sp. KACC 23028]WDF82623.1 TetR/AcrR family transcriptional regulator [Lacticaseibacillus sp. KACC 23028]
MPKRRTPKDPAKEARILAAATKIFAKQGYQHAKTDEIAKAADVSKGLVFNYFGSKGQLYVAAVRASYDRLIKNADLTVWSDSKDLKSMIVRATKYKMQMQIDYPDDFELSMAAYGEVGNLPKDVASQLNDIWSGKVNEMLPQMIDPVFKRLNLREGVSLDVVEQMMTAVSLLIGEESKGLIQANPNITIGEMQPVLDKVASYIDVLEHGILATAPKEK